VERLLGVKPPKSAASEKTREETGEEAVEEKMSLRQAGREEGRTEEAMNSERRRRLIAVALAFGPPVLFAAITAVALWLDTGRGGPRLLGPTGLGGPRDWIRRYMGAIHLANGLLAAAVSGSAAMIRPGTPPWKRFVGMIAGAVAGFMLYVLMVAAAQRFIGFDP